MTAKQNLLLNDLVKILVNHEFQNITDVHNPNIIDIEKWFKNQIELILQL